MVTKSAIRGSNPIVENWFDFICSRCISCSFSNCSWASKLCLRGSTRTTKLAEKTHAALPNNCKPVLVYAAVSANRSRPNRKELEKRSIILNKLFVMNGNWEIGRVTWFRVKKIKKNQIASGLSDLTDRETRGLWPRIKITQLLLAAQWFQTSFFVTGL